MSYREKFLESEGRALSRMIATKILQALDELRSKAGSSPTAPRRWVWELIQNAKDVHPEGGVKIEIELDCNGSKPHVAMRHNGAPFSADNIRFLIEQISTKDRSNDAHGKRRTTGKYGTGFLTTHLLSEAVKVTGIAKEPGLEHKEFEMVLDRSGGDLEEITEAVQRAKDSVADLDSRPSYSAYKEEGLNTCFWYCLDDETSVEVAQAGINDLTSCLAYSLIFVEEVCSVKILPHKRFFRSTDAQKGLIDDVRLESVVIEDRGGRSTFSVAQLSKGFTSIVVPVSDADGSVTLLPIGDDVPRLFCDFPLIGTEKFPFPVIINNPNFNPTEPRDGIYLTTSPRGRSLSEENKAFLRDAVELYSQMLQYGTDHGWSNLHLLAQIPAGIGSLDWVDPAWLKAEILEPVRKQLLRASIVTTASGGLAPMLDDDESVAVWFPHGASQELREKIWHCANGWSSEDLPRLSDVEMWHRLSWLGYGKLTVAQLVEFVEDLNTVVALSGQLSEGVDVFDWLNDLYALIALDPNSSDAIILRRSIFPNQNGDFRRKSQLYREVGTIKDEFKDILALLGEDLRAKLVDGRVSEKFDPTRVRNQGGAVKELNAEISDKAQSRGASKAYAEAFRKMLLYFRAEEEQAKVLFPELYRNKHYLYDDDEISENVSKAEQLAALLDEFRVRNTTDLRQLLVKSADPKKSLLPVTEEILLSMGVTSPEEWAAALEDKDLEAHFSHEKTPTREMFVYVQGLIEQAKRRVIAHLTKLSEYDLSYVQETAPTILGGILKDGRSINIVVRPALNGQVIIYYGSELDVLDYEETSELWVDDGTGARRVTLGRILRQGLIKKFPV